MATNESRSKSTRKKKPSSKVLENGDDGWASSFDAASVNSKFYSSDYIQLHAFICEI